MRKKFVRMILLVLAAGIFLYSSVMLTGELKEIRAGAKQDEELMQMVVVSTPREMENKQQETHLNDAEISSEEENVPKVVAPIQIDFESLCAENPDVIAWIYCPDTPINYPVVQAEDNEYYLHRLLDGTVNSRGTLFMDCGNEPDFSHWNSVIYGHNMKNDSMFGTLTDYKKQAYYDAHPEMYLLTPERDYLIRIVAGLVTSTDSEVYYAFCPDEEEREALLRSWLDDSTFVSENEPSPEDRFITLSTCSYEYSNARYVLIGILE